MKYNGDRARGAWSLAQHGTRVHAKYFENRIAIASHSI